VYVAALRPLADAPAALGPDAAPGPGATIIEVTEGW
jgi:hypothetical protein